MIGSHDNELVHARIEYRQVRRARLVRTRIDVQLVHESRLIDKFGVLSRVFQRVLILNVVVRLIPIGLLCDFPDCLLDLLDILSVNLRVQNNDAVEFRF